MSRFHLGVTPVWLPLTAGVFAAGPGVQPVRANPATAPSTQDLGRDEADHAIDAQLRSALQDDIATYNGSAADLQRVTEAVDHALKRMDAIAIPNDRLLAILHYERLVATLGTPDQARKVITWGQRVSSDLKTGAARVVFDRAFACEQARIGDAAPAIDAVEAIADPVQRAFGYAMLANAFEHAGDHVRYQQCTRSAQEMIRQMPNQDMASTCRIELAVAQADAGVLDDAVQTAAQVSGDLNICLTNLASATSSRADLEARTKSFAAAEDAATKLPGSNRITWLINIAKERSRLGDDAGARDTLARSEKEATSLNTEQRKAYVVIARSWLKAKSPEAAKPVLRSAEHAPADSFEVGGAAAGLPAIARAYREAGDVDAARRVIDAARAAVEAEVFPFEKQDGYRALADDCASVGDLDGWRQNATKSWALSRRNAGGDLIEPMGPTPEQWHDEMIASAIEKLAEANKGEEARGLVAEIASPLSRRSALYNAAHAAARRGQWAASRALAQGLTLGERERTCNWCAYRSARAGAVADIPGQLRLYATPEERAGVATGVALALLEVQLNVPPIREQAEFDDP